MTKTSLIIIILLSTLKINKINSWLRKVSFLKKFTLGLFITCFLSIFLKIRNFFIISGIIVNCRSNSDYVLKELFCQMIQVILLRWGLIRVREWELLLSLKFGRIMNLNKVNNLRFFQERMMFSDLRWEIQL